MNPPPAFRFLGLVVGGWVGLRVLAWMPAWTAADAAEATDDVVAALPAQPLSIEKRQEPRADRPAASPLLAIMVAAPLREDELASPFLSSGRERQGEDSLRSPSAGAASAERKIAVVVSAHPTASLAPQTARGAPLPPQLRPGSPPALAPPVDVPSPRASRWSAYAWLFLRDGNGGALLPGGSLGGSQAGARVTYRLNGDRRRPLALSARFYSALERPHGAEVALGIDWLPLPRVPIHLLAERRERLGRTGRSDWQLTAYGGFDLRRRRLHVEGYGQAGLVGIDRPDLFADGSVRVGVTAGPVEIGGGAWGGAQPGAARFDIGPHAAARLRIGRVQVRAEADWRFRVAGDAAPGSGPALTLSAGF